MSMLPDLHQFDDTAHTIITHFQRKYRISSLHKNMGQPRKRGFL